MEFTPAPATYALIVVNVAVSLYALYGDRNFFQQFAFEVDGVARREEHYRVITSSFLHGGVAHLLFNMMTLYFFGPQVEAVLGRLGFLVVYFGAIVASGITTILVHGKNPEYRSVGASDAVSGVVLSFCLFFPMQPLYIMFVPIGIPAFLFAIFYIVISARLMGAPGARIAHEGHLGGAIAGIVLTILMKPEIVAGLFA